MTTQSAPPLSAELIADMRVSLERARSSGGSIDHLAAWAQANGKRLLDTIDRLRAEVEGLKEDNDQILLGRVTLILERDAALARERALREALERLLKVIDAAGLINLSNGVQLGPTVWFVKASEAVDEARAAPTDAPAQTAREDKP